MGDKQAGMASRVIQLYLKEVMNCFMHKEFSVRLWAMKVVEVVLAQGLVHPVQIVPYLISLSTDPETVVSGWSGKKEEGERDLNYLSSSRSRTQRTSICRTLRSSIQVS